MSTDTRCSPSKIKFVSSAQIAYELNKGPNALRQFCLLQRGVRAAINIHFPANET